nr:MAG: hypothetical protein [Aspergillus flavus virga-like virus 1]
MSSVISSSEDTVDALVQVLSDVFDKYFITNYAIRRQVVTQLLNSSQFFSYMGDKYDLSAITSQILGDNAPRDPFDMQRQSLKVNVGIDVSRRAQLTAANPDYDLTFVDAPPVPHGNAYAQRIISTNRLFNSLSHNRGPILDIGGNPLAHAHRRSVEVHCCTLRDTARDWHRYKWREMRADHDESIELNCCYDGAENCCFQAKEAMSVHTLPDISPDKIVTIFRNHGLEVIRGNHHYDTALEVAESGYMPLEEMHWRTTDGITEFFFDNDSSHSYSHRTDWLKEYSHGWMRTEDDWEYVVCYEVDYIAHGEIFWRMTRLRKDTLGMQPYKPQYRYDDQDDVMVLTVPVFNPLSGCLASDPEAYDLKEVPVPLNMFTYVYEYGISNDTARPDNPLSLEDIKGMVSTFNHVRKVNGTPITVARKLSNAVINDISLGLYLFIVRKAATNTIVYGRYTQHMLRVQRRLGSENFMWLATKAFSAAAVYPFVLMASSTADAIDLMAVHMRAVIEKSMPLSDAHQPSPYRILPPIRPIEGSALHEFVPHTYEVTNEIDIDDGVGLQEVYDVFRDELEPEIRQRFEEVLHSEAVKPSRHPVDADRAHLRDIDFTRDDWHDAVIDLQEAVPDQDSEVRVGTVGEANKYIPEMIYEYGLYNVDVALHTQAKAIQYARETWRVNTFDADIVRHYNVDNDAGIFYVPVINGTIQPPEGEYQRCVDPTTMSLLPVHNHGDVITVDTHAPMVMVCEILRIYNNLEIAREAIRIARSLTSIPIIKLTLVDGIPGCGKTYEIIQTYELEYLIVCTVRSTAEDTLHRMLTIDKFKDYSTQLQGRVRTVDSAVMHRAPRATVVLADEGLMATPGALMTIAVKSKASEIRAYGDSEQIGNVDRGSQQGLLRFPKFFIWTEIEERNETLRLPADVLWVVSRFYPESRRPKFKTRNPVLRSMDYRVVADLNDAIYTQAQAPYVYITVQQADKRAQLRYPGFVDGKKMRYKGDEVFTSSMRTIKSTHESQGNTYPAVCSIRRNPQTVGILNKTEYANVDMTRSTHLYLRVSPTEDDPIIKMIQQVKKVSDETLMAMQLPPLESMKTYYEETAKKLGLD